MAVVFGRDTILDWSTPMSHRRVGLGFVIYNLS
jgi:hypothetical protein